MRWPTKVRWDVENAVGDWLDADDLASAEGSLFDAIVAAFDQAGVTFTLRDSRTPATDHATARDGDAIGSTGARR